METTSYRTLRPIFEELRSDGIVLRPYREHDAEAVFDAVAESRAELDRWIRFARHHRSVDASRDWIVHRMAEWLLRESFAVSLWLLTPNTYLGDLTLSPHDWDTSSCELAYWLRTSATGHGYMTAAVRLLTGYAFSVLAAQRVEIRCDERNERSAAVARRAGFVQEGRLRHDGTGPDGKLRTTLIFSRIPSDE
jgi:ribosomal-protein-serine acetyltransferase